MQVKHEKGFAVIEKCQRCGGEMLYWIEPSRAGAPYGFDRLCVNCITPAEWAKYYRLHRIKPQYCAGGCGCMASRHDRRCPHCRTRADEGNRASAG